MNVKIIGAGLGRTGTLSLKLALERLGYGPCLHMSNFAADPRLCQFWLEELAADHPDWPLLAAGHTSLVDWPACLFVEQLLRQSPTAKVVFTERDFDSWYQSISETVFPALRWARMLSEEKSPDFIRLVKKVIFEKTFAEKFDRESAFELYYAHRNHIVGLVPAEQLLLFDVRDGWEPLCEFLQCEVPKEDFPRENAAGEFFGMLSRMRGKRILKGS
ncbi:hypothetical protein SAMN04487965_2042 [Microbulbifer donghaiensis]|uniref:Sulfotransferase family protein n=1 Tax=Microbulbifer donghaiensis TaxID=494016 RepID=A0A1M5B1W8_9GAMM|nr:sulfotransferase family protein [Microbulbifer donghaiensis]SHF36463.1 hypothetical protein SAMN04487965_2042 [Microbulbifer donghaiensis]